MSSFNIPKEEADASVNRKSETNHNPLCLEWINLTTNSSLDNLKTECRLDCYEIIFVTSGSGRVTIDLSDYDFGDDHVIFLHPGHRRRIQTEYALQGSRVTFSKEFINSSITDLELSLVVSMMLNNKVPIVLRGNEVFMDQIRSLLNTLYAECIKNHIFRIEIIKSLLRIFLSLLSIKVAYTYSNAKGSNQKKLVEKFHFYLNRDFVRTKSVSDYATQLCVTSSYLNRAVKDVYGMSVRDYIHTFVTKEAKRHAIISNLSMKEIAYTLGFASNAHFSKFFKNREGMNFTTFKRQLLQQR